MRESRQSGSERGALSNERPYRDLISVRHTRGRKSPWRLEEMHSLENLRGIPIDNNNELHLSQIRKEWNQFYNDHETVTRDQVLQKASEIDRKYGLQFLPPVGGRDQ